MFNKIKHLKDLRSQAKQLQSVLAEETAEGSAAFGKVKININGNQEILNVNIDPEFLSIDKKEKLEDAVKDASNEAIKKIQRQAALKMQQSGNFNFPGMS